MMPFGSPSTSGMPKVSKPSRMLRAAAKMSAGSTMGNVTSRETCQMEAPVVRAASSRSDGRLRMAAET